MDAVKLFTYDSSLVKFNGQQIVDLKPLPEDKYDKSDVGPMFYATLECGEEIEVFEDEIVPIKWNDKEN